MLLWTKTKWKNLQICVDHPFLVYVFVKRSLYARKGMVAIHFLPQSQLSEWYLRVNLSTRLRYQTTSSSSKTMQIMKPHKYHALPEWAWVYTVYIWQIPSAYVITNTQDSLIKIAQTLRQLLSFYIQCGLQVLIVSFSYDACVMILLTLQNPK